MSVDVLVYEHATFKAASSKVNKHEKACSDNQDAFIPFAFDTSGFLVPKGKGIAYWTFYRIQMLMHNNVVSLRTMNIIFFKRIGFAIQKGVGTLACCPFPSIYV